MFASVALILAAVAGQPASDAAAAGGLGRAFVSPMGEPFYSNTGTNDGLATWFAKVDADHDQAITTDEMKADADKFFDRLEIVPYSEVSRCKVKVSRGVASLAQKPVTPNWGLADERR